MHGQEQRECIAWDGHSLGDIYSLPRDLHFRALFTAAFSPTKVFSDEDLNALLSQPGYANPGTGWDRLRELIDRATLAARADSEYQGRLDRDSKMAPVRFALQSSQVVEPATTDDFPKLWAARLQIFEKLFKDPDFAQYALEARDERSWFKKLSQWAQMLHMPERKPELNSAGSPVFAQPLNPNYGFAPAVNTIANSIGLRFAQGLAIALPLTIGASIVGNGVVETQAHLDLTQPPRGRESATDAQISNALASVTYEISLDASLSKQLEGLQTQITSLTVEVQNLKRDGEAIMPSHDSFNENPCPPVIADYCKPPEIHIRPTVPNPLGLLVGNYDPTALKDRAGDDETPKTKGADSPPFRVDAHINGFPTPTVNAAPTNEPGHYTQTLTFNKLYSPVSVPPSAFGPGRQWPTATLFLCDWNSSPSVLLSRSPHPFSVQASCAQPKQDDQIVLSLTNNPNPAPPIDATLTLEPPPNGAPPEETGRVVIRIAPSLGLTASQVAVENIRQKWATAWNHGSVKELAALFDKDAIVVRTDVSPPCNKPIEQTSWDLVFGAFKSAATYTGGAPSSPGNGTMVDAGVIQLDTKGETHRFISVLTVHQDQNGDWKISSQIVTNSD
jgi:hypothetical protein